MRELILEVEPREDRYILGELVARKGQRYPAILRDAMDVEVTGEEIGVRNPFTAEFIIPACSCYYIVYGKGVK
ncbi:hypothetical protein CHOTACABRAS_119 [Bacillus phage Chotacabras]|nr:hypothetical protein CHOTACABRAS_119 [Bacillus phage Chotacabras]